MSYFSRFKGLPKQVYILGIMRLFVGFGSMVFSLASLLMTEVLGMTAGQASIVVMVQAFANAAGAYTGGKLADLWGRRRSYLLFASGALVFYCTCGFICRTMWVLPFLVLGTFSSNACGPVISALVADYTGEEKRVECFSFLYLCVNLGFAVGPTIGGIIFNKHLPMIFFIQGSVYFVVGVILFILIDEVYIPGSSVSAKVEAGPEGESGFRILLRHKMLCIYIVCLSVVTICYAMCNFMLPLQLTEYFGSEVSSTYTGIIWAINGIVIVVITPAILGILKKNHHFVNCTYGIGLYAIGFGMYAFVKTPAMFFASAIIWSVGETMISTGSGAFIANESPESHRGRFQSYYEIARYMGRAASPPICAAVMGVAGYGRTWLINVCLCLSMGAILFISYKRRPQ